MKDRLSRAKFDNLPVKNPTQNRWTRFMKMPYTKIESGFTKSQDDFKELMNGLLKTRYTEYLEE